MGSITWMAHGPEGYYPHTHSMQLLWEGSMEHYKLTKSHPVSNRYYMHVHYNAAMHYDFAKMLHLG